MNFRDFLYEDENPLGWDSVGDWINLKKNGADYASKKIRSNYMVPDGEVRPEPKLRKTPEEIMGVSRKRKR